MAILANMCVFPVEHFLLRRGCIFISAKRARDFSGAVESVLEMARQTPVLAKWLCGPSGPSAFYEINTCVGGGLSAQSFVSKWKADRALVTNLFCLRDGEALPASCTS